LWYDEELSKFIDQRKKKTKLQSLQDPSHTNAHNGKMYDGKIANTVRTKRREYLKCKSISYEHTARAIKL
jgi:hypothetical protein